MGRRGRNQKLTYIRLASLVAVLVAAFAFHASGSTLAVVRIARIALVAVLVVGAGLIAQRRGRE